MKENKGIVISKILFVLLAVGVCLYLICGEIYFPAENQTESFGYKDFSKGWEWVREDGTRQPAQVPGKNSVERNQTMVIENILPDYLEDNLYMCFRSSKQEMKIYIDGELRQEYSTKDTRPFGRVSAVAYVYAELSGDDAGKTIRVEMSTDSSYTGVLHEVFYGEMLDVWKYLFEKGGVELIIAMFVLALGLASIIISVALKICYRKKVEMEYLGWGIFLAAIWIIANSVFRQSIFQNISVISDMAFFMVMLLSIPFMLYLNQVQSERYSKIYLVAITVNIIDFIVCTALHVGNVVDFSDTIKYMVSIAGVSMALLGITMIIDLITGRIKEYTLVALGILGVCLAAVVQIILYFKWTTQFSGAVIAIAMVFVLIISFVNTMKDILAIEKEKQKADKTPPPPKGFAVPGAAPSNAGFAIPGAPAQQPVAQSTATSPQPSVPVQPVVPQADSKERGKTNKGLFKKNEQEQPVAPAPAPFVPRAEVQSGQPANFGQTTVLGAGNAIGETTVLVNQNAQSKPMPHLIRKKNNEKIDLNKPVFRIGKEKSYVDYFIGDNTAISRSHANIINRDGAFAVVDTQSTNHTFVNGTMLQPNEEVTVSHGDTIRLANEDFEFRLY